MPTNLRAVPKSALLIDDDPPLRKLIAAYLKVLDFTVVEAADGQKAMTALGSQAWDLVCLDLMLPEGSGYDVLEFIRSQRLAKVPVLMMSARSLPEDRAQAEELGATAYLVKPFTHAEFSRAVKTVMKEP